MAELKKTVLIAATSSLLTALVFITAPAPDSAPVAPPTGNPVAIDKPLDKNDKTDTLADAYNKLAEQLEAERQARQALEYEVEWLQTMLDESVALGATDNKPPASAGARRFGNAEVWFDDSALLALGVDEADIADIKEAFNKAEMDKLYLRNQAARTGKPRGRLLMQELRKIQQDLQQQLSADDYDRMLYASGQNNRVQVSDTLISSPAAVAGIQRGDQIVSYAGERIYSSTTLYQATTQGEAGELVSIEIVRNGERINLYLPRGPLGTRFKPARAKPQ